MVALMSLMMATANVSEQLRSGLGSRASSAVLSDRHLSRVLVEDSSWKDPSRTGCISEQTPVKHPMPIMLLPLGMNSSFFLSLFSPKEQKEHEETLYKNPVKLNWKESSVSFKPLLPRSDQMIEVPSNLAFYHLSWSALINWSLICHHSLKLWNAEQTPRSIFFLARAG